MIPRKLFLTGPIGCGKSTMLRHALGTAISRAGGFVTLRQLDRDRLLGFSLAPAGGSEPGQWFLDFSKKPPQNNRVFAELSAPLLDRASAYPFAVLDEFGGLELLVPEFYDALDRFLRTDTPCIGVFKSAQACEKLRQRVPLEAGYGALEQSLRARLQADPEVLLLEATGWQDQHAIGLLEQWVQTYTR